MVHFSPFLHSRCGCCSLLPASWSSASVSCPPGSVKKTMASGATGGSYSFCGSNIASTSNPVSPVPLLLPLFPLCYSLCPLPLPPPPPCIFLQMCPAPAATCRRCALLARHWRFIFLPATPLLPSIAAPALPPCGAGTAIDGRSSVAGRKIKRQSN